MNKDLALSDAAYAFGASIFFLGYFVFEVPSNVILHRIGARAVAIGRPYAYGLGVAGAHQAARLRAHRVRQRGKGNRGHPGELVDRATVE